MSFKVINFGDSQKLARMLYSSFRAIDGFVRRNPLFPYPTLFRLKFGGVPRGRDPWCYLRWFPSYVITSHWCHRQRDKRTDRWMDDMWCVQCGVCLSASRKLAALEIGQLGCVSASVPARRATTPHAAAPPCGVSAACRLTYTDYLLWADDWL